MVSIYDLGYTLQKTDAGILMAISIEPHHTYGGPFSKLGRFPIGQENFFLHLRTGLRRTQRLN